MDHNLTCRAHAIGCAVENLADAPDYSDDALTIGDGYLTDGTATCLCNDTDTAWAAPWVALGIRALDQAAADRAEDQLIAAEREAAAANEALNDAEAEVRAALDREGIDFTEAMEVPVAADGAHVTIEADAYPDGVRYWLTAWDADHRDTPAAEIEARTVAEVVAQVRRWIEDATAATPGQPYRFGAPCQCGAYVEALDVETHRCNFTEPCGHADCRTTQHR